MRTCTIYEMSSGKYVQYCTAPTMEDILLNVGPGQVLVDGDHPEQTYFKGGIVKDIPPAPNGDYWIFDTSAEAWIDPRTPEDLAAELEAARAAAMARITALRGQARLAYITDLPGQDAIYTAKFEEARDLVAAIEAGESADPADYPLVMSEVGVTAPTSYEVAQVFLNLNAIWRRIAGVIDAACFQAQAAIAAAPDRGAMDVILAALANALAAEPPTT